MSGSGPPTVTSTSIQATGVTSFSDFAVGQQQTFTLTPTAGTHGSISPSSAVTLNYGGSQTFAITADAGYHISDVTVDGTSVGAVSSYAFTNVTANHTIAATFGGAYYSQGSLAPNLTTSWNSIRGGGGSSPTSFTSGDMLFIQSGHNMTTTAAWNITGNGASIESSSPASVTSDGSPPQISSTICVASSRPGSMKF